MKETEVDRIDEELETESRIYEIGFHIVPSVGESGLSAEVSKLKSSIESNGGVIFDEALPQIITLAYQMDKSINQERHKFNEAYFGWIKFEASPSSTLKIKEDLDLNEHILRFLIIKTVRESTIYSQRISQKKHYDETTGVKGKTAESKKEKSPELELDKTIEELVV